MARVVNDGKLDDDELTYDGAKLGRVSLQQIGDYSIALRFSVQGHRRDKTEILGEAELFLDFVIVQRGRFASAVIAEDVFSPFDPEELSGLAAKAAVKMEATPQ